jgi:hypothetical protein
MTSHSVGGFIRSNVLGLTAIFIALAGTALADQQSSGGGPSAAKSVVTDAKFKKLKKRVAGLEAKATYPPSGPAGGSLTGTFPNPSLAAGTVGANQIQAGAVTSAKFQDNFTMTLDPVNLAVNTCDNFEFDRNGVLVTDEVIVTPPPNPPLGVIFQARTLAGQIELDYCNVSTGDKNPGSEDYEFSIIR